MDYDKLRKELECTRPLIFFHDDADGLSSFLLFYRQIGDGKGVVVKSHPKVDEKFVRKVEEFCPDKVFIVDLALVGDEFINQVKQKIVWVDHHPPQEPRGTNYYNPRKDGKNKPASLVCYETVKKDEWIAMAGVTGDWHYDKKLAEKFRELYPDLLPEGITNPPEILFDTPIGKISRIFSFVLKGNSQQAMKYVKALTRIKDPYEIMNQTSPQGNFIYKRFIDINKGYEKLYSEAKKRVKEDDPFLIFIYGDNNMSFTGDLSNELLYRNKDKIIIIGRTKSGEVKCSIRASKPIDNILKKALVGVEGYGGGHEHACGAVIKADDFERFIESFRNIEKSETL